MEQPKAADIVVVGGGLAGLAAAAYLGRAGKSVVLFEKAQQPGGRAITQARGDFRFNLGPHALYARGHGAGILRELGIRFGGGRPRVGGYALAGGAKHALPAGFVSLVSTGLLALPAKLEIGRLLSSFHGIDAEAVRQVSVRQWLDGTIRHPDAQRLVQALIRLSTYADDPERQSAGAAVAQVQMALAGGVYYLDDGWQTLVDGLRAAATAAGVQVAGGRRVDAVEHDDTVRGVRLAGGGLYPAGAVIVALPVDDAAALVPRSPALQGWAASAVPVRAAVMDVGLSRLPRPRALFALGVDRPLYLSVHSAVARLAPAGGALIHVGKYLGGDSASDPRADERELEATLDLVQPGWRAAVVTRRFLPNMMVASALPTAAAGGLAGRPGSAVPGVRNLFVCGDWVGPHGQLADASLASGREAARRLAPHLRARGEGGAPAAAA